MVTPNHPQESKPKRLLDQAQARAPETPFFGVVCVAYPKVWFLTSNPLWNHHFRTKNDPPVIFLDFDPCCTALHCASMHCAGCAAHALCCTTLCVVCVCRAAVHRTVLHRTVQCTALHYLCRAAPHPACCAALHHAVLSCMALRRAARCSAQLRTMCSSVFNATVPLQNTKQTPYPP